MRPGFLPGDYGGLSTGTWRQEAAAGIGWQSASSAAGSNLAAKRCRCGNAMPTGQS